MKYRVSIYGSEGVVEQVDVKADFYSYGNSVITFESQTGSDRKVAAIFYKSENHTILVSTLLDNN